MKDMMSMFENLAKQLENMEDGDDDDDMTDEQAMKEAEKMMQGLFGSMAKGEGEDDFMKEMLKSMRKWIKLNQRIFSESELVPRYFSGLVEVTRLFLLFSGSIYFC